MKQFYLLVSFILVFNSHNATAQNDSIYFWKGGVLDLKKSNKLIVFFFFYFYSFINNISIRKQKQGKEKTFTNQGSPTFLRKQPAPGQQQSGRHLHQKTHPGQSHHDGKILGIVG
jgi:hypothetical protein